MKILIIGPSWIGDMVMAQTLFILLKQRFPHAILDVLAPSWCHALLSHMPEEIHCMIPLPFKHGELNLKKRYQLAKSLRHKKYDQAIILPNSLKSALIPFWAKIPKRTGWRGEMRYGLVNDQRILNKDRYPLMIQRFAALAFDPNEPLPKKLPYPKLHTDSKQIQQTLQQFQLNTEKPILAMCPSAEYGPAKRWPPEYFAQVAATMIQQGWQVWLFGSINDKAIGETIEQNIPTNVRANCNNLIGKTELHDAIDLLSTASCVLTNDSGLMHVAAALDKPIVAIYGSSSPSFTPPLSNKVAIMSLALECSPCFQRECPLKHLNCLKQLYPDKILSTIVALTARHAHTSH